MIQYLMAAEVHVGEDGARSVGDARTLPPQLKVKLTRGRKSLSPRQNDIISLFKVDR